MNLKDQYAFYEQRKSIKKYAKMTIHGAVVCTARNKKEAAEKLNCRKSDVYLYN